MAPAPHRVRLATAADHPQLERLLRELDALHARLQPGFFRAPQGLRQSEAELRRALARADEVILLAVPTDDADGEGEALGLVHLRVQGTPPSPAMAPRRRAYIEALVVARSARRRGCGRLLMEEATRWARDLGAEQLVLTVWRGNDEAEAFYERLGYRSVSTVMAREL